MNAERSEIVALDKSRIWHPYTEMSSYVRDVDPIVVRRARGAWLEDVDGRRYLDGNSSWWTAALGHGHPRLIAALCAQAEELAHVSLGGMTHEHAAYLAEELCAVAPPGLSRVFYTDNGSTSVEVAIKMAVQAWQHRGRPERTRFLALDGAFHGETLGATSLGGVEVFRRPFAGVTFDCFHVPFPHGSAYEAAFAALCVELSRSEREIAAVFLEPLVQGASGMRMYSADYLRDVRRLCDRHGTLLILDEVFTGYGRTGSMWACEQAGISPDILCLGKAFASILPMGATLATESVFASFLGTRDKALLYGHTFCGNPLGARVAREVLAVFRDEDIVGQVKRKSPAVLAGLERLRGASGVTDIRVMGMIGAVDLDEPVENERGYLSALGWRVYDEARRRGAYLRPLGDTVYLCPPLTIAPRELQSLLDILVESVQVATERRP